MARAGGVEGDPLVQDVVTHVGEAHDEAEHDLQAEEHHRSGEEEIRDALGLEFHGGLP